MTEAMEMKATNSKEPPVSEQHNKGDFAADITDIESVYSDPLRGMSFDKQDIVFTRQVRNTTMLSPPALAPMQARLVDIEIFDIAPNADVRLLVLQQSTVLIERKFQQSEIRSGKLTIEIPAVPEGMISFLLTTEGTGSQFTLCSIPCCIVPQRVLQDINQMLITMCSIAKESEKLPQEASSDQSMLLWVWKEHFCKFLYDIEVLFECLDSTEIRVSSIRAVLVNMLQQCCLYGAWDFAAYVLSKAVHHGIQISPDPSDGCNNITAESLKTVFQNSSQTVDR